MRTPGKHDFFITYDAPNYKALFRDGSSPISDTNCWSVVDQAIDFYPKRSSKLLFDRSRGVCPDDVFPFEEGQPIWLGSSTVIEGQEGMMYDQYPGPFQEITYTGFDYEASCVLDFRSDDTDGIATPTAEPSYRPHQQLVRDITILGGEFYGANKCAGIMSNKNVGGPSGGRVGLMKVIDCYIQGFYVGVDFGGLKHDAGGDSNQCYRTHVHNVVLGGVGGYSECKFDDFIPWQLQDAAVGDDNPSGVVLTGRGEWCTKGEIAVQLAEADGILMKTGGNGITPFRCMVQGNNIGFGTDVVSPQRDGIRVENGEGAQVSGNTIAYCLGETINLSEIASQCTVHGNTIPKALRDGSSGGQGHYIFQNKVST